MATPQPPTPPKRDRAALEQDLAFTRERLRELAQRYPKADAAVKEVLEAVERTKLAVDLRPTDTPARAAADHAARRLDAAVLERDQVVESIERLRRYEEALAAQLAALSDVDRSAAQAAFRSALSAAIRAEAPAVQRWAGLILLESELVGRQVADLGHLLAEYLTGTYRHSALSSDKAGDRAAWGEAARFRAAFERGEKLP